MNLLCLSNGHGEDAIALRILQQLQRHPSQPQVVALPLVGEGHAYRQHHVPLAGRVKQMPSGGFIYMDGGHLLRDLRGGLLSLTLAQLKVVKDWANKGGAILAVGDIVPLLFAWWSGAPYAFVGTAKSEYYLRDEAGLLPRPSWFERLESWSGSVYLPWERWLMGCHRCKAVFPRDRLTTEILQRWHIAALDLGNPMMDGLEPPSPTDAGFAANADALAIALLPGSRVPEAYENWNRILSALPGILSTFPHRPLLFLGAIAPTLEWLPLENALHAHGWYPVVSSTSDSRTFVRQQPTRQSVTLILSQSAFCEYIHQADVAIAMTGTGTEQFVGLGKPAITLPGNGPQFTPAFAEAQTRLLGPSVTLVQQPQQVAPTLERLLQDPDRLHLIAENGQRRLGRPGAAKRIAACLMERLAAVGN